MKCIKLAGIKKLALTNEPMPQLHDGQVLVAMKAVGVCGSDVHYYNQGRIGSDRCHFPQALGHECAGQVVATTNSALMPEGTRVALEPAKPCMKCELCITGHQNCCPNVKFLGSPGMPGGLQEFLAVDIEQVYPIPDHISYEEAALLEPLGVAYHTIRLSAMQPGNSIAIFGAGPVGLSILAMAQACGAGESFIIDRLDYRLQLARSVYGANHVINFETTDPCEYIRNHTGKRCGVDITFEAAGQPQSYNWCFESARIGGSAMIIGIPEVDSISFNPHPMRRKELLIRNVRRSNMALNPCIDLVARAKIAIAPMATHRFPLDKTADAFELLSSYGDSVIKAMIVF